MPRPRLLLLDVVWLMLGLLMIAGLVATPTAVGDTLGLRRFQTPEISHKWLVAQRFRMNAADLSAIEIRAAAVGPVKGRFRLRIRDLDATGVERSAAVAASDLVRADSYVFRFAPIASSMNHEFEFDVVPDPSQPGRGVALWATKGERLAEGGLRINDKARWAELAFQTQTSAVSPLRRLLAAREPERLPRWLALVALTGQWIALRFVFRAFVAPPAQGQARPPAVYS